MRRTLLPLLLLAACDKGVITIDDTADSIGGPTDSGDPNDGCPVLVVDVTELLWAGTGIGSSETKTVTVTNQCEGQTSLDLSLSVTGDASFTLLSSTLSLAPGASGTVDVVFTPADAELHSGELLLSGNGEQSATVALNGTSSTDYDQDGYDSTAAGGTDCDDFDPGVNPGAPDTWYDGVDSNCDGLSDYDQDGDGYNSSDYSGTDCNDTDAAISPAASETWYDGVDANCDGADDYDQDGDGEQSNDYGGADCDDTDATVNSTNAEVDDALDNDCDGLADEQLLAAGDVLITEVMQDPSVVSDNSGEYFEVLNTTSRTINLTGWTITSGGVSATVDSNVFVDPGGYAVLAASADSSSNGGVTAGWGWYGSSTMSLDNKSGSISLAAGSTLITSLTWASGWPLNGGKAMSLDDSFLSGTYASSADYWCAATSSISGGDRGSPGVVNDNCTSVDHDGDGYSEDDGDCDETDSSIYPDASEDFDGIDNDCDGNIDNVPVTDVLGGYLTGADNDSYLGWHTAVGIGDLTGDGVLDVSTGGIYRGSNSEGNLYVMSGTDYTSWAGSVSSYADYTLSGDVREYVGHSAHYFGDVNGDGVVDLAWSGADSYYSDYYGSDAGGVLFGKGLSTGDSGSVSAITFTGVESFPSTSSDGPEFHPMIINHVDLNGDGSAEVVYGDPNYGGRDDYGGACIFSGKDLGSSGSYDVADDCDVLLTGGGDDYLGAWLGGGDANDDGYDDLFAGAPGESGVRSNAGAVYIWSGKSSLGSDATMSSAAAATIQGNSEDESLGLRGGAWLGDPDNDGDDDLVVGSPFEESVYLFLDSKGISGSERVTAADVTISSGSSPDYFGHGLAWGDFDGDGVDDLAVGAPDSWGYSYSDASTYGSVWLFSGAVLSSGSSTLSTSDSTGSIVGESTRDLFGATIVSGDLNSDGKDDLVITASAYGASSSGTYGRVYVVDW